ncbi:putative MOSC domain-containing protein [Seiridium unicorne]|uniref:MOSC domain-containing protein n=1 Tax=Seiridium unicorne TaxID=138068 RepID=A0ABR2VI51_9PEZI
MAPAAEVDLDAPFQEDIILEVRSSKMKTMPGLTIRSGIDKLIRQGTVPVNILGIEDDEHDPTFHGGIDKAVHGYCSSHYPKWQAEFPDAASRFKPGGFGENLVTAHMNERNVCIGDIISVGDPDTGLLLQVSLPRQPCFKLNHRFHLKNFAPKTYALSRTGWYYRVIRPGSIEAGMTISLVERKHPKWTIERIQEYLHRTQDDAKMNEELSQIEEMGAEARGAFTNRVAKAKAAANRKEKAEREAKEEWKEYKIVEKKHQTDRIMSLHLEAVTPDPEAPSDLLGAHARIKLPNGLVRSYSVVSGSPNRFELGIALEENSRGGSAYFHNTAQEGTILPVSSRLTSAIQPAGLSSSHIFIAGGIGITAFLSLLSMYKKIHWNTILHYAVRSESDVPFSDVLSSLTEPAPDKDGKMEESSVKVVMYRKDKGERLDVSKVFGEVGWNNHVYVCGPRRLMDAALLASKAAGLGEDEVHFEAFGADTSGDPFEVEVLNREKKLLIVDAEETLLEVLRREFGGAQVASSCEVGNCGTCKVTLKSGRVEHRGTGLLEDEKQEALLSCSSHGSPGRREVHARSSDLSTSSGV